MVSALTYEDPHYESSHPHNEKNFFLISEKPKNQKLRSIRELRSQNKLSLRKLGEKANTESHDLPGAETTEDSDWQKP